MSFDIRDSTLTVVEIGVDESGNGGYTSTDRQTLTVTITVGEDDGREVNSSKSIDRGNRNY